MLTRLNHSLQPFEENSASPKPIRFRRFLRRLTEITGSGARGEFVAWRQLSSPSELPHTICRASVESVTYWSALVVAALEVTAICCLF